MGPIRSIDARSTDATHKTALQPFDATRDNRRLELYNDLYRARSRIISSEDSFSGTLTAVAAYIQLRRVGHKIKRFNGTTLSQRAVHATGSIVKAIGSSVVGVGKSTASVAAELAPAAAITVAVTAAPGFMMYESFAASGAYNHSAGVAKAFVATELRDHNPHMITAVDNIVKGGRNNFLDPANGIAYNPFNGKVTITNVGNAANYIVSLEEGQTGYSTIESPSLTKGTADFFTILVKHGVAGGLFAPRSDEVFDFATAGYFVVAGAVAFTLLDA